MILLKLLKLWTTLLALTQLQNQKAKATAVIGKIKQQKDGFGNRLVRDIGYDYFPQAYYIENLYPINNEPHPQSYEYKNLEIVMKKHPSAQSLDNTPSLKGLFPYQVKYKSAQPEYFEEEDSILATPHYGEVSGEELVGTFHLLPFTPVTYEDPIYQDPSHFDPLKPENRHRVIDFIQTNAKNTEMFLHYLLDPASYHYNEPKYIYPSTGEYKTDQYKTDKKLKDFSHDNQKEEPLIHSQTTQDYTEQETKPAISVTPDVHPAFDALNTNNLNYLNQQDFNQNIPDSTNSHLPDYAYTSLENESPPAVPNFFDQQLDRIDQGVQNIEQLFYNDQQRAADGKFEHTRNPTTNNSTSKGKIDDLSKIILDQLRKQKKTEEVDDSEPKIDTQLLRRIIHELERIRGLEKKPNPVVGNVQHLSEEQSSTAKNLEVKIDDLSKMILNQLEKHKKTEEVDDSESTEDTQLLRRIIFEMERIKDMAKKPDQVVGGVQKFSEEQPSFIDETSTEVNPKLRYIVKVPNNFYRTSKRETKYSPTLNVYVNEMKKTINFLKKIATHDQDLMMIDYLENILLDYFQNNKKSDHDRIKRHVPIETFLLDPKVKVDMPKLMDNVGTFTKTLLDHKDTPIYHIRNFVGSLKDTAMATMKIPNQNFIVPTEYNIVDNPNKEETILESSLPNLSSRFGTDTDQNPEWPEELIQNTFQNVGQVVRNVVKSGQEAVQHVGELTNHAKKVIMTTRQAPDILLQTMTPIPLATDEKKFSLRSRFGDDSVLAQPKEQQIGFIKLGHLLDAAGVSNPEIVSRTLAPRSNSEQMAYAANKIRDLQKLKNTNMAKAKDFLPKNKVIDSIINYQKDVMDSLMKSNNKIVGRNNEQMDTFSPKFENSVKNKEKTASMGELNKEIEKEQTTNKNNSLERFLSNEKAENINQMNKLWSKMENNFENRNKISNNDDNKQISRMEHSKSARNKIGDFLRSSSSKIAQKEKNEDQKNTLLSKIENSINGRQKVPDLNQRTTEENLIIMKNKLDEFLSTSNQKIAAQKEKNEDQMNKLLSKIENNLTNRQKLPNFIDLKQKSKQDPSKTIQNKLDQFLTSSNKIFNKNHKQNDLIGDVMNKIDKIIGSTNTMNNKATNKQIKKVWNKIEDIVSTSNPLQNHPFKQRQNKKIWDIIDPHGLLGLSKINCNKRIKRQVPEVENIQNPNYDRELLGSSFISPQLTFPYLVPGLIQPNRHLGRTATENEFLNPLRELIKQNKDVMGNVKHINPFPIIPSLGDANFQLHHLLGPILGAPNPDELEQSFNEQFSKNGVNTSPQETLQNENVDEERVSTALFTPSMTTPFMGKVSDKKKEEFYRQYEPSKQRQTKVEYPAHSCSCQLSVDYLYGSENSETY